MINWHVRFDWKLWNILWFYYVFWAFSYIILDHSCLNYCFISTKISLIVCLIENIYWYINMPDVTANYGIHLDFITFFACSIIFRKPYIKFALHLKSTNNVKCNMIYHQKLICSNKKSVIITFEIFFIETHTKHLLAWHIFQFMNLILG